MPHGDSLEDSTSDELTLTTVSDGQGFDAWVLQHDDEVVVAVSGEIDMATADLFWQALDGACERAERVVVDLTDTTFIDSSGLAVLVRAHKRLDQRPDALVVRAPNATIRQVLGISGLDGIITVIPDQL
jgi:anti-anti-sigma factor